MDMDLDVFFAPLTLEEMADAPVIPDDDTLFPMVPVPDGRLIRNMSIDAKHPTLGAPQDNWAYVDRNGRLLGYTASYGFKDEDGNTQHIKWPWTFCEWDGGSGWRSERFPRPWPLYQLNAIHQRETATILICDDERMVVQASALFPEMVATTIPFGLRKGHDADLSPLAGRRVAIASTCEDIFYCAYDAGAVEVKVLRFDKLGSWIWRNGQKFPRSRIPYGWTLCDALADGWTAALITAASEEDEIFEVAPRLLVHGEFGRRRFRMSAAGVEREVEVKESGVVVGYVWKLVCGRLELIAETRDGEQKNWGKLLNITDDDGKVTEWHMSNEDLSADGAAYREALQNTGLKIEAHKMSREYLYEYLSTVTTGARARRVDRVGWHGGAYVTTTGVIGQSGETEPIVFAGKNNSRVGHCSGTLDDWQENIANYAVGNSNLVFALCLAFSAPLLEPLKAESGGFHFVGNSSIGKTSTLLLAGSVWGGGGGPTGYLRSWRATTNGIEGLAAAHCDCLLCMDEMGQVNSREVGQAAYMLANGAGKTRADRRGDARKIAEWRIAVLSTGELGLADKVLEDTRGSAPAAGQQLRIIDLMADAGAGMGIFENIHGFSSAAEFAQHLQAATGTQYGHAGRRFVECLVEDLPHATALAQNFVDEFHQRFCHQTDVDGQVKRVAQKFAVVAAAGEMAIALGVVTWSNGEAMTSVGKIFTQWLAERGTHGSMEEEDSVAQIRAFIEAHGSSRFFNAEYGEHSDDLTTTRHDRVGFVHEGDGGPEYCFFLEAWKKQVCKGRNHKSVAQALAKRGLLVCEAGRLNKVVRLRSQPHRVFVVKETILLEPEKTPSSLTFEVSPTEKVAEQHRPASEIDAPKKERLKNLK